MEKFLNAVLIFAVYSFFGWIAQGFYVGFKKGHFVNTGFMYGPVVPIYGFGALLVIYGIDPLTKNPVFVFLLSFLICSVLEYFTSWAMQKLFHRLWWNYSDRPFNIHGRVCLLNSTLYGIGGLVITYLAQPLVSRLVQGIPEEIRTILAWAFLAAFVADLAATLLHMASVRKALHQLHELMEADHSVSPEYLQNLHAKVHLDRHAKVFDGAVLCSPYKESCQKAAGMLGVKSAEDSQQVLPR